MNISNDIILYRISEYTNVEEMFKLGLTSKNYNKIYKEYETRERRNCILGADIRYIYDRDSMSVDEKKEILCMMSAVSGKSVNFLKMKLLNYIVSRKNGKKMQSNYTYLYDCFSPVRYCSWFFKYATDKLLADMYFRDIEGYKAFVEKSATIFNKKEGKQLTEKRIDWFINEINIHNYIIEDDPEYWWYSAIGHCFKTKTSDDLLIKLINKMHLFGIHKNYDVLDILSIIFLQKPTENTLRYLSYFNFDMKHVLFTIEELYDDNENAILWLNHIIKNKQLFDLDEDYFSRENLEDMLLPYNFVDAVVNEFIMINDFFDFLVDF